MCYYIRKFEIYSRMFTFEHQPNEKVRLRSKEMCYNWKNNTFMAYLMRLIHFLSSFYSKINFNEKPLITCVSILNNSYIN